MKRKWRVTILTIPILCLALAHAPVSAQESEEESADAEAQPEAAATEETAPAENQEPSKRAADTLDTFIPSEEVSSDLSVSFPVDI